MHFFYSHLDHVLGAALAAFFMLYGGIIMYTSVGRVLEPAAARHELARRPPLRAHLRLIWCAPRWYAPRTRALCSARVACPPCCTALACWNSGGGRSSA